MQLVIIIFKIVYCSKYLIIHSMTFGHSIHDFWSLISWHLITHFMIFDHTYHDIWSHIPWHFITHSMTFDHTFRDIWSHIPWDFITHSMTFHHTFHDNIWLYLLWYHWRKMNMKYAGTMAHLWDKTLRLKKWF